jgi:sugar phosphate isomerase/epimerase
LRLAISGQLLAQTHALPRVLEILGSLGVDAIEIWPHNLPGGETREEQGRYEHKDIAGAREILASHGVSVACVTLGFDILGRCAEVGPGYGTGALKGAVDAAAALKAPLVNCYLAGIIQPLFVEAMRPAAEYASSLGITIVLENEAHDDSGIASGLRSIVEAVRSPHFGTVYDPCNYYQANEEPYPAAYEIVKDYVRYVHLKGGCQYDPERRPNDHRGGTLRGSEDRYIGYTSIPEGAINADGVLRRLTRDGYTGFVTLEPHVPAEKALEYYHIEVPYVLSRLRQEAAA